MESKLSNGAILVYRHRKISAFARPFVIPEIKDRHSILFNEQEITIFIIEYPVFSGSMESKRMNKLLSNILKENKIDYVIEKHIEEGKEYSADKYNIIKEIKAIKLFSAIYKLSKANKKDYLSGSIGFVMNLDDIQILDLLTDEASNIMIYEFQELDKKTKNKIYTDYMEKKGISIVFSKELDKIIRNCDVLLVDEAADLNKYHTELGKKIILGKNQVQGNFSKVEEIIMWNEYIEDLSINNNIVYMHDEMLALQRYFNKQMHYTDFIKEFEHIYLFNDKDKLSMLYNTM